MNRFAASIALASVLAVTAMSPAMARHHYAWARLGAGVCAGSACTGAFFPTAAAACSGAVVATTTRYAVPVKKGTCPSGLGIAKYMVR
jgi:hypothetical protein